MQVKAVTSWLSIFFFVALVLAGTNLMVNMLLAIIKESFSTSVTRNLKKQKHGAAQAIIGGFR